MERKIDNTNTPITTQTSSSSSSDVGPIPQLSRQRSDSDDIQPRITDNNRNESFNVVDNSNDVDLNNNNNDDMKSHTSNVDTRMIDTDINENNQSSNNVNDSRMVPIITRLLKILITPMYVSRIWFSCHIITSSIRPVVIYLRFIMNIDVRTTDNVQNRITNENDPNMISAT